MKAALVLCCLAAFVALHAADYVCNRDGNNMPDCTNSTNLGVKIRNFWDPTRYWLCNSTTSAAPASVICVKNFDNGTIEYQGFFAPKGDCVSWSEWTWTQPCA
ncbi:uncharacterized protein Peritrophin-15a [Drosophila kikkawai]|uniref:Uncharacterized protein Peritrophin-15a n=1 Tax=Drosophila kikkawai TaxID=30033 RepID=A0A6P4IFQ3_DROKI